MSVKSALVTGSSSGIGKSIALELAGDGYFVLVHCNRNREKADAVLGEIKEAGGAGAVLQFDVSDYDTVKVAIDAFLKEHPEHKITALVNNAGVAKDNFFALMSKDDFDSVIRINLLGTMNVSHCLVRHMMRAKNGSIVNISSLAGQTGNMGQTNYSASKAGVIAFTKSLSQEVGSRGIRVNCVAPGLIETEMLEDVPGVGTLIAKTPLKRLGKASEVAGVVSFLCSEKAGFVNGATISVNGGLYPN